MRFRLHDARAVAMHPFTLNFITSREAFMEHEKLQHLERSFQVFYNRGGVKRSRLLCAAAFFGLSAYSVFQVTSRAWAQVGIGFGAAAFALALERLLARVPAIEHNLQKTLTVVVILSALVLKLIIKDLPGVVGFIALPIIPYNTLRLHFPLATLVVLVDLVMFVCFWFARFCRAADDEDGCIIRPAYLALTLALWVSMIILCSHGSYVRERTTRSDFLLQARAHRLF